MSSSHQLPSKLLSIDLDADVIDLTDDYALDIQVNPKCLLDSIDKNEMLDAIAKIECKYPNEKRIFKFLTWNINVYLQESPSFNDIFNKILNINADILCLQESSFEFLAKIENKYTLLGQVMSHAGWCSTLIKTELLDYGARTVIQEIQHFPPCAISVKINQLTICNVHLYPSKENLMQRNIMLKQIINKCGPNLLIVGDHNMNDKELITNPKYIDHACYIKNFSSTWHLSYFQPAITNVNMRFDRIHTDLNADLSNYTILGDCIGLSDHDPIMFHMKV